MTGNRLALFAAAVFAFGAVVFGVAGEPVDHWFVTVLLAVLAGQHALLYLYMRSVDALIEADAALIETLMQGPR